MVEDRDRLTEILGGQDVERRQSLSDCITRKPGETFEPSVRKGSTGITLCTVGSHKK